MAITNSHRFTESCFDSDQLTSNGASTIVGKVSRVGYYRDQMPLVMINIRKQAAGQIPYSLGNRIPVVFVVDQQPYIAGIRVTTGGTTVTICPDLVDNDLKKVRLVDLLHKHGRTQKDSKVLLSVDHGMIFLL